jgi:citrate synthase
MADGEYKPGLEGIPATQSNISYIDGQVGLLEYRGIPIEQLTEHSHFLETSYLLAFGHLPTQAQLDHFIEAIRHYSRIKYRIRDMIKSFPPTCNPMDALQTCVAGLGLFYPIQDYNDEHVFGTITRLLAKLPIVVATFHQMRQGDDPIPPRTDLNYAANFLYMLSGQEPDERAARIFDICLILHAEHTVNASTFALLVSASTLANPFSAIASAVGTLSGQLHGGANELVLRMLREIGSVENVRPYVEDKLARKQRIMGMGHRVYKLKDPRATILQKLAEELFEHYGHDKMYDIALEVEKVCAEFLGDRGIYPNVDFYSGLVYAKLGIPEDLFTPVFAISRAAGWLAHWREQLGDNRIFRPTQMYIGEHNVPYVPLEAR